MLKILFVDIDGVLNNHKSGTMYFSGSDEKYGIDERNVQNLYRILRKTDCKIVWSTNWRNHSDDWSWGNEKHEYRSPFPKVRNLFKNFVYNKRPCAPHYDKSNKYQDITAWIFETKETINDDLRFAILDDMTNQELDKFGGKFFHIDSNFGLTEEVAESVIHYFNV